MELSNIEKLLERYFEATATVAEEEMLREYFAQEDVPLHLKEYAPMFQYFSIAREEKFTRQVPLKPRKKSYIKWISIAAVSILIFGIYFGRSYQEQREAEYAYQETKKALSLLATNLGKGTEKVAYLREFEETKQKIYNKN
ncbi:hypothetical protein [Arenibacter algicola]|uniref:Uncharacterized protein n=1 Tax=Arenibacter algicola TaxID=616991 RepID=A0A221V3J0_9FLAO|nr:hypothetical protein [Arenibacter algicola]ASO08123.1 hypothetical protein AREALGSMS7_04734 [Arenibacter algicola]HCO82098.1 hypothetical protein [Arenibacter sp.]|tara:strand:+ start:35783 stop:36205 length:423 start_codon:yes stop_codon:yes gene_type:complete